MRPLLISALLITLAGCKHSASPSDGGTVDACAILFGSPNASTGLGPDQCRPECSCNGSTFKPPAYSAAFIQSLTDDFVLTTPYQPLTTNPYTLPVPPDDPAGTVCAVVEGDASMKPRPYTLMTFATQAAATAAGAHVTHFGHCGVCSTLANLAVYMRNDDLTAPVRSCAFATSDGGDPDLQCLMQLGFDLPCAQIWEYNTMNTKAQCLQTCVIAIGEPYNESDGSLNACLQCDEDKSGPVFKAVAGRTRRNSGVPNAICRPCSEVQPLIHSY